MLIHTAEGKRSIDEELVLCIDRHRGESERCIVTVYLLSGERVQASWRLRSPTTIRRCWLRNAVPRAGGRCHGWDRVVIRSDSPEVTFSIAPLVGISAPSGTAEPEGSG